MATLKDVSKLAKVSPTTVSIVVNGNASKRRIPQETVDRVNAAVKELNYHPSVAARALRNADLNKFTIGVYWTTGFRSSYLTRFMKGLQTWKEKSNMEVNIMICPFTVNELYKEAALFQTDTYNAVIIATASEGDLQYIHKHTINAPTVLTNRTSEIYNTVAVDSAEMGHLAAQHLIERGVKSAAIIALNNKNFVMSSSVRAFIAHCKIAGVSISDKHIITTGYTFEEGYEAGRELIKRGELPDAIFVDNDSLAIGLLECLRKQRIDVPDDIQVISLGLGNPNYARYIHPSLTVVDVPLELLAEEAMKLIEDIAEHRVDGVEHRYFNATLLPRATTKML